jgi:hypothetical protein
MGIFHTKDPVKNMSNRMVRCIHTEDNSYHYAEIINNYDTLMSEINGNERLSIGSMDHPLDLGNNKILLDIKMVFHIVDPKLAQIGISQSTRLNNSINKIITQLNADYNVNFNNDAEKYIDRVEKLFSTADPSKKDFYTNLVSTLPNTPLVTWKFSLHQIIINPNANLVIAMKLTVQKLI